MTFHYWPNCILAYYKLHHAQETDSHRILRMQLFQNQIEGWADNALPAIPLSTLDRSSLIPSLDRIYLDIFEGHTVLYLSSRYKINHTAVPHKALDQFVNLNNPNNSNKKATQYDAIYAHIIDTIDTVNIHFQTMKSKTVNQGTVLGVPIIYQQGGPVFSLGFDK